MCDFCLEKVEKNSVSNPDAIAVQMESGDPLGHKVMRQVMHGTCSYSIETILFIGSYSIGGYLGENNPGSIETMG